MPVLIPLADPVALRKESVDRNDKMIRQAYFDKRSLSARRAWIEMLVSGRCRCWVLVALRKESVDRNHKKVA